MREILFRGKRVDSDEWVYGQHIKLDCYLGRYAVFPETIGQFTGLCDKNGKKIFEGDIVEVTTGVRGYKSTYSRETYTVSYKSYEGVAVFFPFTSSDIIETEVIGNKYDNKEEDEE